MNKKKKKKNGAQFLNTTCIPLFPLPEATSATVLVPLTSIYASTKSNKLDLNTQALNLI